MHAAIDGSRFTVAADGLSAINYSTKNFTVS